MSIKPFMQNASSTLEGLIEELHAWAGIDKDLLLYHMSDRKDEGFGKMTVEVIKMLKDL